MAAALRYVEGDGPIPHELELLGHIQTYGVEAVMGRPVLGAVEIRRMTAAHNVEVSYASRKAYRDQDGKENWVEWARAYPQASRILVAAERADYGE